MLLGLALQNKGYSRKRIIVVLGDSDTADSASKQYYTVFKRGSFSPPVASWSVWSCLFGEVDALPCSKCEQGLGFSSWTLQLKWGRF